MPHTLGSVIMRSHRLLSIVAVVLAGAIGFGLWIFAFLHNATQRILAVIKSVGRRPSKCEADLNGTDSDKSGLQELAKAPLTPEDHT